MFLLSSIGKLTIRSRWMMDPNAMILVSPRFQSQTGVESSSLDTSSSSLSESETAPPEVLESQSDSGSAAVAEQLAVESAPTISSPLAKAFVDRFLNNQISSQEELADIYRFNASELTSVFSRLSFESRANNVVLDNEHRSHTLLTMDILAQRAYVQRNRFNPQQLQSVLAAFVQLFSAYRPQNKVLKAIADEVATKRRHFTKEQLDDIQSSFHRLQFRTREITFQPILNKK